jgi:hypothetical protein
MSAVVSVRSTLLGMRRKLERSIDRRGLAGTAGHAAVWPVLTAARRLSPAYRAARREDRDFDARHGVDTGRRFDADWTASFEGWTWRDAIGYNPVRPEAFHRALGALAFEPQRTVFVDFGAGKGRAMLLATHYPFRRVLGVEQAKGLQQIAAGNLARYWPAERICRDAEIACGDALAYPIPDEPAVFFFYDPFGPMVFAPVVERIRRSLAERPRPAWLVYHYPRCGELVEAAGFERRESGDPHTAVYAWPHARPM